MSEPHVVWWNGKNGKRCKGKIVDSLIAASNLAEEKGRPGCVAFFKKIPHNGKEKRRQIRNDTKP